MPVAAPLVTNVVLTAEEQEEQTVRRLSVLEQGVIYQDSLIQISMKSQFASGKGMPPFTLTG